MPWGSFFQIYRMMMHSWLPDSSDFALEEFPPVQRCAEMKGEKKDSLAVIQTPEVFAHCRNLPSGVPSTRLGENGENRAVEQFCNVQVFNMYLLNVTDTPCNSEIAAVRFIKPLMDWLIDWLIESLLPYKVSTPTRCTYRSTSILNIII